MAQSKTCVESVMIVAFAWYYFKLSVVFSWVRAGKNKLHIYTALLVGGIARDIRNKKFVEKISNSSGVYWSWFLVCRFLFCYRWKHPCAKTIENFLRASLQAGFEWSTIVVFFPSLWHGQSMTNLWSISTFIDSILSNLNEVRTKVQPHKLGKNNYETNRIKRFFLQSIVSEITVVRLSSTRNTNQPTNDRTSERARRKHAHNFESRIHLYASWNSTRSWTVSQLRHTHTGKPEGEKRTN